MSIASRITITWTPSANALSQDVQRATSSSGPWTTLASSLGPLVAEYVDESTVDNPFTTYYYKIITNCTGGATTTSSIISATAQNCPTSGANTIFGLKSTNAGLSTAFNYYDRDAELFGFTATKTVSASPTKTRIVCHKCGQTVEPTGPFAAYGDVSYMTDQNNIGQYLPAAAIGGTANYSKGTVYRKTFGPGFSPIPSNSKYAYIGTRSGNTFVSGSYVDYNLKNWTAALIGRYVFQISGNGADQLTELNGLNQTNLYVALLQDSNVKCEVYIYQATRNTAMDVTNSGTPALLGFNLTYVASVISGGYQVYSIVDTPTYTAGTQPNIYFKFFNL